MKPKTLDEDFTDGIAYGFPICCVLAFINAGGTANGKQALERGVVRNQGNPYVPCGIFHFPDETEPWERGAPYTLTRQRWDGSSYADD